MAAGSSKMSDFAANEIEQMLEDYNQQQCPDDQLQPVSKWSQTIIEKLQLHEDHDILLVDPETAVTKIFSSGLNLDSKEALKKFFSAHLSEMKFLACIKDLENLFNEFVWRTNGDNNVLMLSRIVENLEKLKSLISDPDRFEKALAELVSRQSFEVELKDFCFYDDSAVVEKLAEVSQLSETIVPVSREVRKILQLTKLEDFLFKKISLATLIQITSTDAERSAGNAAWRLLRGLTHCNYRARNEAGLLGSNSLRSLRDQIKRTVSVNLHPMDVLYVSFLCCDLVAKQFLCQRLFACKLAFPFFYKNELDLFVQSNWALRDIYFEFSDSSGKLVEINLVEDIQRLPVVSFIRIGELILSKSKVLNQLMNTESHETFFSRDSENGELARTCSNGLVEAAVRLRTRDLQVPEFLALNLRGDLDSHPLQAKRLIQSSQVCVVFICGRELSDALNIKKIKDIKQSVSGMLIVVSKHASCTIDEDMLLESFEKQLQPLGICVVLTIVKGLNLVDCIKIINETLNKLLSASSPSKVLNFRRSNDLDTPLDAVKMADQFYEQLRRNSEDIDCNFPLQGDLWKKLSDHDREILSTQQSHAQNPEFLHRSNEIIKQMYGYRQTQIKIFYENPYVRIFLQNISILKTTHEQQIYFESLRFILNCLSRKQATDDRKKFLELSNEARTSSGSELKQQLAYAETEYQKTKLELSNFFREISLMFEACAYNMEADMPEEISNLPRIFAHLLLSGVPIEILDGNVGNIPMKWISAVLRECSKLLGDDKKLLVVSVLGTQSTGKSTLLNTMFGLRLPVSCGRCTRGAFLQLVQVDTSSNFQFDYLALIDTEGLRAIERSVNAQHHDNELATLVIGLADLTLFTVNGEDSPDMRDVLQIVIHAFIKMKRVQRSLDLKRRCLFVHQNVSDAAARERLRTEIIARQSLFDEVTRAAAEKEGITDFNSFSDIILFSPDKDTFLMPSLWRGDPPMAPVNEGFSKEVQKLKQHMIDYYKHANSTCLNFTDLQLRTKDLWSAVLSQNFVFSFRNSIEMKAYDLLNEKLAQIKSQLRESSFNFFRREIVPTVNSKQDKKSVKEALEVSRERLLNCINELFESSKSELKKYFDDSEYRLYICQWESAKFRSLETKKTDLNDEMKKELQNLKLERTIAIEQDDKIEEIKSNIRKHTEALAKKNLPDGELSEEKISQAFELFWNSTLENIAKEEAPDIELKLREELLSKFSDYPRDLIESVLSKSPISSPAADPDCIQKFSDLTKEVAESSTEPTQLTAKQSFPSTEKNIKDNHSHSAETSALVGVKAVVKYLFDYLCRMKRKRRPFRDSDANKFVGQTFQQLNWRFNEQSQNLELKFEVAVYACRLAHQAFTTMQKQFVDNRSLKSSLEGKRVDFCRLYKSRSLLDIAAIELQMYFESELQNMLNSKSESQLSSAELRIHGGKQMLIRLLLQYGIDVDGTITALYITDPKAAALKFITHRTEKILFQNSDPRSSCKYLCTIRDKILNPANEALLAEIEALEKLELENTDLILTFCQKCESWGIPLSITRLRKICEIGKLAWKDLFAMLRQKIHEVHSTIIKTIEEQILDRGMRERLPGFKSLCSNILDGLWGCEHRCPLCGEPCKIMDENHAENDEVHSCFQHRPMGLNGSKLNEKNEIATYTCSYFATAISSLMQGTKSMLGDHKKFRCTKCPSRQSDCSDTETVYHKCYKYKTYFPDWNIEPDFNATVSDLWKWLAASNRSQLIRISAHYSKIPEEWQKTTKESAKASLDKIYGE